MELLAHGLIGAAIGEILLGKRLGNRALIYGAAAALLPCLDLLAIPFLDTANLLWWRQGPSHSMVVAALASILLAKPLANHWKREKISNARAGTFLFAALLAHIILDCMGGIGVALLWPLPFDRVAFGNLPQSDPLLIMPLLICIPWLAFLRKKKEQPKRRRLLAWGVGLTAAYAGFTAVMRFTADAGFQSDFANRGFKAERRIVIPYSQNAFVWRTVVDRGDELWVGYRSVFQKPSNAVRWTVYPRGVDAAAAFNGEREVARIQSFTNGFWIARAHKRGLWIADLRSGEQWETAAIEETANLRMLRAWNFESKAPKDRLIPSGAQPMGFFASLRKSGWRILNPDPMAGFTPRLVGVPGQFPETLQVME